MTTDILTALAALIFVLALLGLASWAVKRFGLLPGYSPVNAGAKSINIRETRMIDAKSRLVVAEWQGSTYFLGISQSGIDLIDKRPLDASKQSLEAHLSERE